MNTLRLAWVACRYMQMPRKSIDPSAAAYLLCLLMVFVVESVSKVYRHALVTAFTASELEVTATNQFRQWVKERCVAEKQRRVAMLVGKNLRHSSWTCFGQKRRYQELGMIFDNSQKW